MEDLNNYYTYQILEVNIFSIMKVEKRLKEPIVHDRNKNFFWLWLNRMDESWNLSLLVPLIFEVLLRNFVCLGLSLAIAQEKVV